MILFLVGKMIGCSHTPEGAPVSTQVADVAKDTIAIASGKAYAVSELPTKQIGVYTRIELMVLGLMACSKVVSKNVYFEIASDEKKIIASGAFNGNWQSIVNAHLASGQHYNLSLKLERTGKPLEEFDFLYSGAAPWQIQVTAQCPS
jgi:hypothetical protein